MCATLTVACPLSSRRWHYFAHMARVNAQQSRQLLPFAILQGYQMGKTKVFLRAGQMAVLDKLRTELMNRSATTIQRHIKGFTARRRYQRTRRAAITLQVCELRRAVGAVTHHKGTSSGCVCCLGPGL